MTVNVYINGVPLNAMTTEDQEAAKKAINLKAMKAAGYELVNKERVQYEKIQN